jgi:hypothetical protein
MNSLGLITFDSLCPAFNLTAEQVIVEKTRRIVEPLEEENAELEIPLLYLIIGGAVLVIIVIALVICCVLMRKNKQFDQLEK